MTKRNSFFSRWLLSPWIVLLCASVPISQADPRSFSKYSDRSNLENSAGADWPGYGRTYGEQHYSPLADINSKNIRKLGLAWSLDLEPHANPVTQALAVDGVIYYANGYSLIHAVDAATGKLLWKYDPKVPEAAGPNLRLVWGSRGIAWWSNKIYTGTADGRLIAVNANTGEELWARQVFPKDSYRFISGAPRVFNGKVVTGFSGTGGPGRSYINTYDAETGDSLWRFYTSPGNPDEDYESEAMEAAAKTWSGDKWWRFGGGGSVWNAMAYDPELDLLYIGTGSGHPWNRRVRSEDEGDNLYISSIVALAGSTGEYRWHYQTTPGDTWDYDATMDIQLADIELEGKPRKVLIQAPKNGFFYVLDRESGELISAKNYARVSWATGIDLITGRPNEVPGARYPAGASFDVFPSPAGAHNWTAMAYSPRTKLAYIPRINRGVSITDKGLDLENWELPTNRTQPGGWSNMAILPLAEDETPGTLLAWDIAQQKEAWSIPFPTEANGGVLATGGDLVFQGTIDGTFSAYSAESGKHLWKFQTGAPIMAAPISYAVDGEQYISVLTGLGTGHTQLLGIMGIADEYGIDSRTMPRRLLTFKPGGEATLPEKTGKPVSLFVSGYEFESPDTAAAVKGFGTYLSQCHPCHGLGPSTTHAPDLRRSPVSVSAEAFKSVVQGGALVSRGMPKFEELSDAQLLQIRHLIFATALAGKEGKEPIEALPEALRGLVPHQ